MNNNREQVEAAFKTLNKDMANPGLRMLISKDGEEAVIAIKGQETIRMVARILDEHKSRVLTAHLI
jgi:hypothetical protein